MSLLLSFTFPFNKIDSNIYHVYVEHKSKFFDRPKISVISFIVDGEKKRNNVSKLEKIYCNLSIP